MPRETETPLSPIFIVGCPRSGTTLLASLLGRTPWGAPFETHFIPKYERRLSQFGDLRDRRRFRRLLSAILSERPVKQFRLELDIDAFYESLSEYEYPAIVDALCRAHTQRRGLLSWGDKTPHYVLELRLINRLFPRSRIIYIVRDGRDTALSLIRRPWGPANIVACAQLWKRHNEVGGDVERLTAGGMLYVIKYEELLSSPDSEMKKVLHYLGLEDSGIVSDDIFQKINKNNYGKWKQELSPDEVRLFESVAAGTLRRFGYETTYPEQAIPWPTLLKSYAHDRIKHVSHLVKINTVDEVAIRWFGAEPFAE